ncbi:MAG TPA: carotenoid biosynthesis protein [Candidatus Thermoplasmatota archaeon]|nr:carotenoid biosynthesis protein [Candidatus Thermoplasmatota archaeon]
MALIEINQNFGEHTQLLAPFIAVIAIAWVILVYYSYKKYGTKLTIVYFLPIIIATLLIESAGVAGGRYYYPGYILYLSVVGGAVPVIIVLAWSVNLFLFMNLGKYFISKIYKKQNYFQIFFISLAAGLFGVCLDLLEDPIAHYNNWWIWETSLKGIKFFEVPILNFIGWFVLVFFMCFVTLLIVRSRFSENRKVLLSISSLAVTGSLIFIVHGLIVKLFEFVGMA